MPEVVPTSVKVEIHRSEPADNTELALVANGDRTSYAIKSGDGHLYAVTHTPDSGDSGTLAHDAATTSSSFGASPDPFTFSHTPSGTPRAVIVYIFNITDSSFRITGVSYGGVPLQFNGAGGGGGINLAQYFLRAGVPSGTQTISIDHDGNAATKQAIAVTLVAGRDIRIPTNTVGQLDKSIVISGSSFAPSHGLDAHNREGIGFSVVLSEHDSTSDLTPLAGQTEVASIDFGSKIARVYRWSSASIGVQTVGFDKPSTNESMQFQATLWEEVEEVSKLEIYDVDPLGSPSFVGTVAAVDGLVGNKAEHGLVFDSTGRYLYAMGAGGTLYTLDTNTPTSPSLVDTQLGIGGFSIYGHTVHRIGSDLFRASSLAGDNAQGEITRFDISSPAAPSSSQVLALTSLRSTQRRPLSVGYVTPDDKWILYPVFAGSLSVGGAIAIIDVDGTMSESTKITLPEDSSRGTDIEALHLSFLPNPSGLQDRFLTVLARNEAPDEFGFDAGQPRYFWMTYKTTSTNAWDTLAPYSHDETAGIADPDILSSILLATGAAAGRLAIHRTNVALSTAGTDQPPIHARLVRAERGENYIYVFIQDDDISKKGRLTVWEYTNLGMTIDSSVGRTTPRLLTSVFIQELHDLGPLLEVGTTLLGIGGNTSLDSRSFITLDPPAGWVELPVSYQGIDFSFGLPGDGPADRVANTGKMSFLLENFITLGKFSPDSSNLFAGFRIGREIRLAIDWDSDTWYPWWGLVDKISPQAGKYSGSFTLVACVDFMDYLSRAGTNNLKVRFDESATQGVHLLLNRAKSDPVLVYFLNKAGEVDIYTVIFDISKDEKTPLITELQKVCQSERSFVYVAGGVFYFEGRNIRSDAVDGSADLTLTDTELLDLVVDHSARNLINNAEARVHPRRFDSSAITLFNYDKTQELLSAEVIEFNARYRDPDLKAARVGGFEMIAPEASTDFTLNTLADGTGTDITGQLTVTVDFGGNSAKVKIVNNGPSLGHLTLFKFRGKGIYTYEPISVVYEDEQSEDQHGPLRSVYSLPYSDSQPIASDAAQYILHKYGQPTTFLKSLTIRANQSSSLMDFIVKGRIISTLLDVSEEATGLSSRKYFVQNARVSIRGHTIIHAALGLTPADTDVIFKFGDGIGGGSDMDGEDVLGSSFIS